MFFVLLCVLNRWITDLAEIRTCAKISLLIGFARRIIFEEINDVCKRVVFSAKDQERFNLLNELETNCVKH
jgi:hypothetical protein